MLNTVEQHFHQIRRELVDSRSTIDVVVLRPICDDCLIDFGVSPIKFTENYDPVALWPPNRDQLERIYDRSSGNVIFFQTPPECSHVVHCSECHKPVCTLASDSTIRVLEQDFTDHFGIEEPVSQTEDRQNRKFVPRWKKELIRKIYGGHCFGCKVQIPSGAKFELDHIHSLDKSGTDSFINFQPLCLKCGSKKRNSAIMRFSLALDMYLRPAPSDSFEGIWERQDPL